MRSALSVVFMILVTALLVCLFFTGRSKKEIKEYVTFLLIGMALPVTGNLILIVSTEQTYAELGCYVYFLGMDIAVYSLLRFTHAYCDIPKPKAAILRIVYALLALDFIQYMLNPFMKLSFSTEMILVDGLRYYRLVPYIGQTYHRVLCYGIFLAVIIIFVIKGLKTSRIYAEKYWIMLLAAAVTGVVETYYIFSRQPLDMSMIGFGLFGILVFYFALYYRPMKLLDRMLAGIISEMPEALFFFDRSGKCIWTNEPGRKLIGISQNNYDKVKEDLVYLFGDIEFGKNGWSKKVVLGAGDEAQYTTLSIRSVDDDKDNITGTYLSVRDITEDQRELKREMYNSTHDALTGVFTKEYLYEQIDRRLQRDRTTNYMVGYIEIANYKVINDVFGKRFGEFTQKRIADFIKNNTSSKVLFGKLSEDSFGILLDKDRLNVDEITRRLENFTIKDEYLEHRILIHFGIYDINKDEPTDVPLFFDSARLATTMIRDSYHEPVVFYDDELRNEIIHNQMIANQVKDAIADGQLRPYLQPIVDSDSNLVGAEALVRWIHPDEGLMNPAEFIPIFEHNGQIADVDRHMWRSVCEILSSWKERGIESFISVNISPKDFYFIDVVSELKGLTEEFGIDPSRLRVEITESAMVADNVDIFKIVRDLRDNGFIVEMDDFGSGYSSLNLLKDLNFDVIKIDMQFLKDSERNEKAGTIIRNIINMSKDLGMDTLTEGVETPVQFERLTGMGCKLYQGYYFSRPAAVEDFEKQWFG